MKRSFTNETFSLITTFETIYFWPDLSKGFEEVNRLLKNRTFMICNESNGENHRDKIWVKMIQGMVIYSSEQIDDALNKAGFVNIKADTSKKGWLCAVANK